MRAIPVCLALACIVTLALAGCVEGPKNLRCTADAAGNHLSWSPVENATSYDVFRFVGDVEPAIENSTYIGSTTGTTFTDTNVTKGETYRYWVSANVSDGEQTTMSLPSELCEVTSVPFFPTPLAAIAAVGGAGVVVAVIIARRR